MGHPERPSNGEHLRGHELEVTRAAFSQDCERIATASTDRTVRLWNTATAQQLVEPLGRQEDTVWSIAFSPDGRRIAIASGNSTRLWDVATGRPISEPLRGHEDWVICAAFSPNGRHIVTASWDNTARLWEVFANVQEFVTQAKATAPRALTVAQRSSLFLDSEPLDWHIEMNKWPYHTPAWRRWFADKKAGKQVTMPVERCTPFFEVACEV
jgi:WD40 repeat protein